MPQCLARGHRAVDAALLQHDPDPRSQGRIVRTSSQHLDSSGIGGAQSLANLQGGGLPGAVGSEHRGDGAPIGGQVEPVDHSPIAVALDQARDDQSRARRWECGRPWDTPRA